MASPPALNNEVSSLRVRVTDSKEEKALLIGRGGRWRRPPPEGGTRGSEVPSE